MGADIDARDEDLPHAHVHVVAHRMAAAVPVVEVADDANVAGGGRPHDEAHAGEIAVADRVRAEDVVEHGVVGMRDRGDVVVREGRPERIRIVDDVAEAVLADPDAVAGALRRLDARDAQAGGMHALERREHVVGMVGQELDLVAPWDEGADVPDARRNLVRAEDGVGIAVRGGHDGVHGAAIDGLADRRGLVRRVVVSRHASSRT